MRPTRSSHPAPEQLAAFHAGRLDPAEWVKVERHLTSCAACRAMAATLPPAAPAGAGPRPGDTSPGAARDDTSGGEPPAAPPGQPGGLGELAQHPRYQVLGLLGTGGMGAVYRAQHRLMERLVALKVINKTFISSPQAVERFRREVKAAARLSHTNIVAAYDAEQAGDLHFLVMEYVEGVSLDQLVARKGPLPVDVACNFARQAALGLQHAHEQGMIHRDLKPQNLMLAPKGRVKILDFGLARFASETEHSPALTHENAVMGTPDYFAPEQATDARSADIRSDLYSLGCTLYFLLVGRPPFPEGTVIQKVFAHVNTPPKPVTTFRADIPAGLQAVLDRLLEKDPARRYQTPREVYQALAPFARAEAKMSTPAAAGSKDRLPVWVQDQLPTEPERPAVKRRTRLKPPPARPPVPFLTAAYLALAAGAFLLAALTGPGLVAVRSSDPEATVAFKQGGRVAGVAKARSWLRLPPGPYEVEVRGGRERLVPSAERVRLRPWLPQSLTVAPPRDDGDREGWVSLFNGKDLTGWQTYPSGPGGWTVQDGVLTCAGPRSHLFSERDYENFLVRAEARVNDGGNSGLLVRARSVSATEPPGYEAQINSTNADRFQETNKTGSLWKDGHTVLTKIPEAPVPPDTWFLLEVLAEGNRLAVRVNGKVVSDYVDDRDPYLWGHVALQHAGPGTAVQFKRIEIKELPATKKGRPGEQTTRK